MNVRTVRASVIGQTLMKQFGKKKGKKLVKSLAASHKFISENNLVCSVLTGVINFKSSAQGIVFWWHVDGQQRNLLSENT
jgi:hypothetical protein